MRLRCPMAGVVLATIASLCVAAAPVAIAQDESPGASPGSSMPPPPSAFCAILAPTDVSGVTGADVTVGNSTGTSCSYTAADGSTLTVLLEAGDLATITGASPSDEGTTVAGQPAYVTPDGTVLYVQTVEGVLSLGALGFPGDAATTTSDLMSLAEIGVPRLASIPLPSAGPVASLEPSPSMVAAADPELGAMFPTTIGGQPIIVQTHTARQLAETGMTSATRKAIVAGLAAVGKTLDDMSLGFSSYANGDLSAVRVRGVDAASIEPQLLRLMISGYSKPRQTPTKLHGKKVIKVTEGKGSAHADPTYFYAHDDVLWEMQAPEPDLTEIFADLP